MTFCLGQSKPPWDPNLPRASICIWPYDMLKGEIAAPTVLEVYRDSPQKIRLKFRQQDQRRRTTGVPVWEPIQEIIDYEVLHGR